VREEEKMKRYIHILLLLLALTIGYIECSRVSVDYSTNSVKALLEGAFIYSPKSSVPHSKPGDGFSYFNASIVLNLLDPSVGVDFEEQEATIDLLVFREGSSLGYTLNGQYSLCCTQAIFDAGQCQTVGSLIISDSPKKTSTVIYDNYADYTDETVDSVAHHITVFNKSSNSINNIVVPISFEITNTGIYYAFLISCNEQIKNPDIVYLNAKADVIFMNPYGYLSGELFPLIYFDLILGFCYVGLGILWVILFFRYRSTALRVQYWISLVIIMGFLESMVDYGDLNGQNKSGKFSTAGLFFTTLLGTLKRGFARSLVLLVSMGYGIVVPTLPRKVTFKIIAITVAYMVFRFFSAYLPGLPSQQSAESSSLSSTLLQLPVAVLDALFYFWTLMSLSEILKRLSERSQSAKILMFRKFIWVLMYSITVTCIIIIIQLICSWTKSREFNVKYSWVLTAFWDIAYFVVLAAICWIWRPTENNQQFAYSELDTDDSVVMESTNGGVVTQRNTSQYDSDGNKVGIESDTNNNGSSNNFTIVENLDDDEDEFDKKDLADRYFKSF